MFRVIKQTNQFICRISQISEAFMTASEKGSKYRLLSWLRQNVNAASSFMFHIKSNNILNRGEHVKAGQRMTLRFREDSYRKKSILAFRIFNFQLQCESEKIKAH